MWARRVETKDLRDVGAGTGGCMLLRASRSELLVQRLMRSFEKCSSSSTPMLFLGRALGASHVLLPPKQCPKTRLRAGFCIGLQVFDKQVNFWAAWSECDKANVRTDRLAILHKVSHHDRKMSPKRRRCKPFYSFTRRAKSRACNHFKLTCEPLHSASCTSKALYQSVAQR